MPQQSTHQLPPSLLTPTFLNPFADFFGCGGLATFLARQDSLDSRRHADLSETSGICVSLATGLSPREMTTSSPALTLARSSDRWAFASPTLTWIVIARSSIVTAKVGAPRLLVNQSRISLLRQFLSTKRQIGGLDDDSLIRVRYGPVCRGFAILQDQRTLSACGRASCAVMRRSTEGEIARNLSGTRNRKQIRQLWKVGGNPAPKV
jgi:hypothetical protein